MAALLVAHHRPGFYFRVLEEGEVGADDEIVKVAEGPERLSVAAVDGRKRSTLRALAADWLQIAAPAARARFDVVTFDGGRAALHRGAFA